jgi:hypothetical protein
LRETQALPSAVRGPVERCIAFRTVSQTVINYRDSALSEGRAGEVHGGDRLPWVRLDSTPGSADNFAPLTSLEWQVHVYGGATAEVRALCAERRLPLHEFAWQADMQSAGLHRDGLYLVRPDGYVALAAMEQRAKVLASYLDARGIRSLGTASRPGFTCAS